MAAPATVGNAQMRSSLTAAVMAANLNPSPSVDIPSQAKGSQQPGSGVLLTPPNSISPTLPPHMVRQEHGRRLSNPPPIRIDSDPDLRGAKAQDQNRQDPGLGGGGSPGGNAQEQPQRLSAAALSTLSQPDPTGAITPQMLAAHHLPGILIDHGPVAIRHVLSYLTQSVPGFARIPPAKARRLVVAALENRGCGGKNGEVIFEKIGWGRWGARFRREKEVPGQSLIFPPKPDALSPPASVPGSYALSSASDLPVPAAREDGGRWSNARNGNGSLSPGYGPGGMWAEHEADKMSLDGSEDFVEVPFIKEAPMDMGDTDDETEDEDWAAIGAAALRQASLSAPKSSGIFMPGPASQGFKGAAKSVPMAVPARPQGRRENRHYGSLSGSHSYLSGVGSRNPSRRGSSSYGHGAHPYATSLDQRIRSGSSTAMGLAAGLKGLGSTLDRIPDTEATVPVKSEEDKEREAAAALLHMGART